MTKLQINMGHDSIQVYNDMLDSLNHDNSFSLSVKENDIIIKFENDEYIEFVAHKITSHIINNVQPRIIREIVEIECFDLFDEDIVDISTRVEWELLHKDKKQYNQYFLELKSEILNLLTIDNYFNLDGFINFRFKNRKKEIYKRVDIVIDQFFREQENSELIRFVKRCISIQQPITELLHVIMYGLNNYEIINGNRERIDVDELRCSLEQEIFDGEYEAIEELFLITSILMTLAPRQIILHTNEKQDPYIGQVLLKAFEDRIETCHGCEYCEGIRAVKEDDFDDFE